MKLVICSQRMKTTTKTLGLGQMLEASKKGLRPLSMFSLDLVGISGISLPIFWDVPANERTKIQLQKIRPHR